MALIVAPITGTDDPKQTVVQALHDLQPALTPEQVQVSSVNPPSGLDGPVWRFELTAPALDPDVTVFNGSVDGGLWRRTGAAAPAEIRGGLVVDTEHGLVVVGVHEGDEDDINELVEQALAHIQLIEGG